MAATKIEWADRVWNPTTGCSPVSTGCMNCYAVDMHRRLSAMGIKKYSLPFYYVKAHLSELDVPFRWKKPMKIFVNSMSDLFHSEISFQFIDLVMTAIKLLERHTFMVLTKRPGRMLEYLNSGYLDRMNLIANLHYKIELKNAEPPENLWLGVTAENQKYLEDRIYPLLAAKTAVRWISFEPQLGEIDLDKIDVDWSRIHWAVIGCESGHSRRRYPIEYSVNLAKQCKERGIKIFPKQFDINGKLERRISKFPEPLMQREYPEIKALETA